MKKEKKVNNIDELLKSLIISGKKHNTYYHYTTWNKFEKIYKGASFILTRGNSLKINDQHESKVKGSWSEWNKTYIGSFSFGNSENMAMWGLYGIPWENAVRIAIPKKAMLQWIDETNNAYIWENGNIGTAISITLSLSDIVYVEGISNSGSIKLTHRDKKISVSEAFDLTGLDTNPCMTGFIKNYAWRYENEVRFIAKPQHSIGEEKILIEIPTNVLSEIKVTTGPSFKYRKDNLYEKLYKEGRIVPSDFENLLNFQSPCNMCEKGPFVAFTGT